MRKLYNYLTMNVSIEDARKIAFFDECYYKDVKSVTFKEVAVHVIEEFLNDYNEGAGEQLTSYIRAMSRYNVNLAICTYAVALASYSTVNTIAWNTMIPPTGRVMSCMKNARKALKKGKKLRVVQDDCYNDGFYFV